jgi:hypothetical protein
VFKYYKLFSSIMIVTLFGAGIPALSAQAVQRQLYKTLTDDTKIQASENYLQMIANSRGVAWAQELQNGVVLHNLDKTWYGDFTYISLVPSMSGRFWMWIGQVSDLFYVIDMNGRHYGPYSKIYKDSIYFNTENGQPFFFANIGDNDILVAGTQGYEGTYNSFKYENLEARPWSTSYTYVEHSDGTCSFRYNSKTQTQRYNKIFNGPIVFNGNNWWGLARRDSKEILVVNDQDVLVADRVYYPVIINNQWLCYYIMGNESYLATSTDTFGPFAQIKYSLQQDLALQIVIQKKDGSHSRLKFASGKIETLNENADIIIPESSFNLYNIKAQMRVRQQGQGQILEYGDKLLAGPFSEILDYRYKSNYSKYSWVLSYKMAGNDYAMLSSSGRHYENLEKALGYEPYYQLYNTNFRKYPWAKSNERIIYKTSSSWTMFYYSPKSKHEWYYRQKTNEYGYELVINESVIRPDGFNANYDASNNTLYWFELENNKIFVCSLKLPE